MVHPSQGMHEEAARASLCLNALKCETPAVRARLRLLTVTVGVMLCGLAVAAVQAADRTDSSFGGKGFIKMSLPQGVDRGPVAPNIWDLAKVRGGFVGALADLTTSQDVFAVVRYRRNGVLDRGFGKKGFTRTLRLQQGNGQAQAFAVQPDGRIVLGGYWRRKPARPRPLLARFHPDGSLDRSFGSGGVAMWRRPGRHGSELLHDIAIQSSGRIVGVGAVGEHGIGESSRHPAGLVIAYRPDGRIDRSFGRAGRVAFRAPGGGEYTGLKTVRVLPGGKLLVAGFHHGRLLLARLLPDGELDASFGGGTGRVNLAVNSESTGCGSICFSATALELLPDGRIIALSSIFPDVPVLVRLWPDGELDRGFGRRGIAKVRAKRHWFKPFDMTLQRGRILVVGWDEARRAGSILSFAAFRYRADGRIDRSFGRGGVVVRRPGEFSGAFAALDQPGGRVVVAGGGQDKRKGNSWYSSYLLLTRYRPG
jgi:uncharacterized delta-60 repeat protein